MHISEAMRTRILLFFLLFTTTATAQQFTGQRKSIKGIVCPFEDYIGTWQYASNDTVFTVKFVEGRKVNSLYRNSRQRYLFGGYALEVGGVLVEDYLNVNDVMDIRINLSEQHIYIDASVSFLPTSYFSMLFYDQRKKHLDGNGISGCFITMVAKNKLKWELNEERGISAHIEGCEDCPEIKPIGFSVPTNVILTKVE